MDVRGKLWRAQEKCETSSCFNALGSSGLLQLRKGFLDGRINEEAYIRGKFHRNKINCFEMSCSYTC